MEPETGQQGAPPELTSLGPDHYKAIGYVVVAWSFMETLIDATSWELAQVDQQHGACLTSQIAGSSRKLDALLALIRYRVAPSPALDKKLNRFAKDTMGLAERRNRVIHDPWVSWAKDGKIRRFEISARKNLKVEAEEHTTERVMALALEITNHAETFRSLMNEVQQILPEAGPE